MGNFILGALARNLVRSPKSVKQLTRVLQLNQRSAFLRQVTRGDWFKRGSMGTTNKFHFTKVDLVLNWREYLRKGLLNKPGLREQGRRLATKENLRNAFRTLGKDHIKSQVKTGMRTLKQLFKAHGGKGIFTYLSGNLASLFRDADTRNARTLSSEKYTHPVSEARSIEKNIIRRLVTNKRSVVDRAPLSSSWCYFGVYMASSSLKDYGQGTLLLTVKHEYKDGSIRIGKTYPIHNYPLAVGSLMKAAMGRDGTGAGSVYGQSYIKGMRTGRQIAASKGSSQVA